MTHILDEAAWAFLHGNTARANNLVERAKSICPKYFEEHGGETLALKAELDLAVETKQIERVEDNDKYTDEHVIAYWESALREFETMSPRENANAYVFDVFLRKIGGLIDACRPDAVVDFGCACGLPLYRLARQFQDTHFTGVDRQSSLARLNGERFSAPNLGFRSGSVFRTLPASPGASKMLVHFRTGIMVYPAFLERLYAQAKDLGFQYIALYEIASLSCISWAFRDQGTDFASEPHRSTMFIHDYAAKLSRVGFHPFIIEHMPHGYALARNNMLPGDTYVFIAASLAAP